MNQTGFDEQELLQRLRKGDSPAFRSLYELYGARLFAFARRFGLSTEDAREIVQESFIRIWEHRTDIRNTGSFNAYLITIARNLIYNSLRRNTYREKYVHDTELLWQATRPAVDTMSEKELRELIRQAVLQLPDKCREVFCKSRYEGFSNQQIADELAISKSTVENQLNKALKTIRKFLENNGYGPATIGSWIGLYHILTNYIN